MNFPHAEAIKARRWFYRFELPDGTVTDSYLAADTLPIHTTRRDMLFSALTEEYGSDWSALNFLDIGCHEGWFAVQLAQRGAGHVYGVDANPMHVENAIRMSEALGLEDRLGFHCTYGCDLDSSAGLLMHVDVVVMLGLLYHVSNPIELIAACARAAKHTLIVESQVMPPEFSLAGRHITWGHPSGGTAICGTFGLVRDYPGTPEGGLHKVSLVPDAATIEYLLHDAGFAEVKRIAPPDGGYCHFHTGDRVMFAAHRRP